MGIAATNERKPVRRITQISLQQPLELDQRLVVKNDVIDVPQRDARFLKTIADSLARKPRIVLLARKALLLDTRHEFTIAHHAGSAVMVVPGDAEDLHASTVSYSRTQLT